MASPPPISTLSLDGMVQDGELRPEKLLYGLNQFLEPTHRALNRGLTLEANCRAQWHKFRAKIGSDVQRVAAVYTHTTSDTVDSGTPTIHDYDTKVTDTHNAVTTGAAWKFTVPTGRGGLYSVSATGGFAGVGVPFMLTLFLYKGGSINKRLCGIEGAGADGLFGNGSTTIELAAGEYIDIRIQQDSGSPVGTENANGGWISIAEVPQEAYAHKPAAFWPYTFAYQLTGRPRAVLATEIKELTTSVPINVGWRNVEWEFASKDNRPHIRIRNIPGLAASRVYEITLLVIEA